MMFYSREGEVATHLFSSVHVVHVVLLICLAEVLLYGSKLGKMLITSVLMWELNFRLQTRLCNAILVFIVIFLCREKCLFFHINRGKQQASNYKSCFFLGCGTNVHLNIFDEDLNILSLRKKMCCLVLSSQKISSNNFYMRPLEKTHWSLDDYTNNINPKHPLWSHLAS